MTRAELKIGDWVSFEGKPFQIYDMTRYGDVVWYDEGASSVLMEDIEPIPLTKEILEKNGWKKKCSNYEIPGWSNSHIKLYPKDKVLDNGFWFVYSCYSARYIHSVHQLQHLLWALGLDDDLKL